MARSRKGRGEFWVKVAAVSAVVYFGLEYAKGKRGGKVKAGLPTT